MSMHNYSYINDFAGAASWYDKIPPLVSKTHPREQDLRPLNNRRLKWERIKKISDKCYALMTWGRTNDIDSFYGEPRVNSDVTRDDIIRTAPIVWQIKGGKELCTVHNALGRWATGWCKFLTAHLPCGMRFVNENGVHHIEAYTPDGRTKYYLPQNRYAYKGDPYLNVQKTPTLGSTPKFERKLVFERVDLHRWMLVSESYNRERKSKNLVDRDKKKAFKPLIDAFREWLEVMAPLIVVPNDYRDRMEYITRLKADYASAWPDETVPGWFGMSWWDRAFSPEQVLDILKDDAHPMRIHLATAFMNYNAEQTNEYERRCERGNEHLANEPSKIRARYNAFMNKQLGLIKENL